MRLVANVARYFKHFVHDANFRCMKCRLFSKVLVTSKLFKTYLELGIRIQPETEVFIPHIVRCQQPAEQLQSSENGTPLMFVRAF